MPQFFKDSEILAFASRAKCAWMLFLLCTLLPLSASDAKDLPRELPVRVSIASLLGDEAQYDGHRVVVAGRIESLVFQRGRMGSPYLKILLLENPSHADGNPQAVAVISLDFPKARAGDRVLVQGNYHVTGRKAGRIFDRFIDAEVIILDEF